MGAIKGVLREELENSLGMRKDYQRALNLHPGGCFVRKQINGNSYYYLALRDGKKVKFTYKGKSISKEDVTELENAKCLRRKYKKLMQKVDKQIKYLKKALRGKEDV